MEEVDNQEKTFKFKKGVNKFRNIGLFAKKAPSNDGDAADFIPEVRRRFLFDDTLLKRGASIHKLFKADEPPEEDFNEIVDKDDDLMETFVSEELVGNMIEGMVFKIIILGLIIVNSMLIGLQTDEKMSVDYAYIFSIFDQTVMAIFLCEILLKWYCGFWIFWKVGWNILDFIIIGALLLGPSLSFLSSSRILRILRVLRAFRSLRSVSALAGLSMVVQTILQSVPDMANIVLLLFIILLVFAVSGVTLFGKDFPLRFGDLPTAMFSLFICVTQDGWVGIFAEFKEHSTLMHVGGAFYFFLSIMVGAFVFANLVVAVVVTNLELAMKELKEEQMAMEDVLATSRPTETDEYGILADGAVTILPVDEAYKNIDPTHQTPLQLVDLKNLNYEKSINYFLVLNALEENLAEYISIKEDFLQIHEVVRCLNVHVYDDLYDDESDQDQPQASRIDLAELKKGDILSNLIKLEKKNLLSSKEANTMSSVLKSAASGHTLHRKAKHKSSTTLDPKRMSIDVDGRKQLITMPGMPGRKTSVGMQSRVKQISVGQPGVDDRRASVAARRQSIRVQRSPIGAQEAQQRGAGFGSQERRQSAAMPPPFMMRRQSLVPQSRRQSEATRIISGSGFMSSEERDSGARFTPQEEDEDKNRID